MITKQHCFYFKSGKKGSVRVGEVTTSVKTKSFSFLKNGVTPEQVCCEARALLSSEEFVANVTPLESVPIAKESNRRGYLLKEVCERYHENDTQFEINYFAPASGPVNREDGQ